MPTSRSTVDLSAYPQLVVIYLGMRVNVFTGIKTLLGFGPKIESAARARPPGLLRHEAFLFSFFPPHAGIRQYWKDFESLEAWARSDRMVQTHSAEDLTAAPAPEAVVAEDLM